MTIRSSDRSPTGKRRMFVNVLGKRWKLRFAALRLDDGRCDPPDGSAKEIVVDSKLVGRERLDTLIHEMLHAANWHLDEEFVTRCASDMAKVLWRLGYRPSEK